MSSATAIPGWVGSLEERGGVALMSTYARLPLELYEGSGCRVRASDGREYLDFLAGIAVNVLGHRHPKIVAALHEAAEGLLHVSNLYWTEPMVRLAERLTAAAGMERAFFCNSGAESVEAALKLARKARPGRLRLVCFDRSFHGRTTGALAVTAQPKYQAAFGPLLPGCHVEPFGDAADLAAVDDSTAAVIVEPIQGEGGMRPAPAGWLTALRQRCDAVGALLIFDEVQSGIGRTGHFFAYQSEGVTPDAVTSAKGLAGGLPMGVLLARGEAAAVLGPGDHASTFGGGPFVASVANAVLDVVLAEGFLEAVAAKGERLRRGLEYLAARHDDVLEVRGRGLMLGLALSGPHAGELSRRLQEVGLLVAPAGPDVLRFVPPLTVDDEAIDEALELVGRELVPGVATMTEGAVAE